MPSEVESNATIKSASDDNTVNSNRVTMANEIASGAMDDEVNDEENEEDELTKCAIEILMQYNSLAESFQNERAKSKELAMMVSDMKDKEKSKAKGRQRRAIAREAEIQQLKTVIESYRKFTKDISTQLAILQQKNINLQSDMKNALYMKDIEIIEKKMEVEKANERTRKWIVNNKNATAKYKQLEKSSEESKYEAESELATARKDWEQEQMAHGVTASRLFLTPEDKTTVIDHKLKDKVGAQFFELFDPKTRPKRWNQCQKQIHAQMITIEKVLDEHVADSRTEVANLRSQVNKLTQSYKYYRKMYTDTFALLNFICEEHKCNIEKESERLRELTKEFVKGLSVDYRYWIAVGVWSTCNLEKLDPKDVLDFLRQVIEQGNLEPPYEI